MAKSIVITHEDKGDVGDGWICSILPLVREGFPGYQARLVDDDGGELRKACLRFLREYEKLCASEPTFGTVLNDAFYDILTPIYNIVMDKHDE